MRHPLEESPAIVVADAVHHFYGDEDPSLCGTPYDIPANMPIGVGLEVGKYFATIPSLVVFFPQHTPTTSQEKE